jgi:hypothetical protein
MKPVINHTTNNIPTYYTPGTNINFQNSNDKISNNYTSNYNTTNLHTFPGYQPFQGNSNTYTSPIYTHNKQGLIQNIGSNFKDAEIA